MRTPPIPVVAALAFAVASSLTTGCGGGDRNVGGGGTGGGHAVVGPATLSNQIVVMTQGFPGSERANLVETADVDVDGDLDVFFGTRLYLNTEGSFEEAPAGSLPGIAVQATFGDVDGDGDADLFAAGQLWLNDGSGHFVDVTAAQFVSGVGAVQLADLDGDGDQDAVGSRRVFLNNGAGYFTEGTTTWTPPGAPHCRRLADFDGDGDPDWLGDRLLRNTGQAFVIDPTPVPFPGTAFAVGDLDGDGDLDIAGSNFLQGTGPWNVLLLNDGAGHFVDRSGQLPQHSNPDEFADVEIGDVDADGDLDVVIATQGKLLLNDGTAHFTEAPAGSLPALYCHAHIRLADLDGDRDLDLATRSGLNFDCPAELPNLLLLNDGHGRFRKPGVDRRGGIQGFAVDVDGDLDVDVLNGATIDLNDGTGAFTYAPTGRYSPPADGLLLLAVGDVDGNGSPDAVFGGAQDRVYLNDGSGRFVAVPHPVIGDTRAGALGDVDGDGDLDLVLGRGGAPFIGRQTMLLVNDGRGGFADVTAARMPADAEYTTDVAFGDVDRDGDLDLVLASQAGLPSDGRIRLYLNDGAGAFLDATGARLPGTPCHATGVTLVDLERDGDLDILIDAVRGPCWYRNAGNGVFADASAILPFCGRDHRFEAATDLDGDGDVDLAVNESWHGVSFFLQDAPAVFREDPASHLPVSVSPLIFPSIQPIDYDGDGDVEWFRSVNLARHLFAPGAATVGRRWRLQVFARPGWLAATHLAHVYVGFALASRPIAIPPLGVFALEPSSAALTTVTIPAPFGKASLLIQLPADPALIGLPVHAQALIADPNTAIGGFTNRITAIIGS